MFQPLLSMPTALALISRPTQRKMISKTCVFQTCFPVLFDFVYLKQGLASGPGSPKVAFAPPFSQKCILRLYYGTALLCCPFLRYGNTRKRVKLSILISFEIQADEYTPFGGTYTKIGAIERKLPQLLFENDAKMHKAFRILYKEKKVKQMKDYPNY